MSELDRDSSDHPNAVPQSFSTPAVTCQECGRELTGAWTVRDGIARCLECEACKCQQETAKGVWMEGGE